MTSKTFTKRVQEDLHFLGPALIGPLQGLKRFSFRKNRALVGLSAIGLAPLAIMNFSDTYQEAYWALALYFSCFWLACFFIFFRKDSEIRPSNVALCYFGSIVAIILYQPLTVLPPMSLGRDILSSNTLLPVKSALAFICIGIPEESCKSIILFVLWRTGALTSPRTMLIYGMISGLAFGIREGVFYQTGANIIQAHGNQALYYLLNILRLTSLPFIHAIWTGIAGYFIGFARLYPQRRIGFIIVSICIPAILHGMYDASTGAISLCIGALSVVILGTYLNAAQYFHDKLETDLNAHTKTQANAKTGAFCVSCSSPVKGSFCGVCGTAAILTTVPAH